MTALMTDNLPLLAGAPNGIKKLRELILELAVRGKLVPQDPSDEPARELLKRIAEEKARLMAEGKIKTQKPLAEIGAEESPFELPEGWEWGRLSDCSKQVTDGEHLTPPRTPDVSQIPLVTAKNVRDGYMDYTTTDFVVRSVAEKCWERCCPEQGDIMMVSVGATLGRLTIVPTNQEMVIVRSVTLIKPLMINVRYLALAMKSPTVQRSIWAGVKQSAQPCLYLSQSTQLLISIPPLTEQYRIGAKVDELMALCDRLEAQQVDAERAHARLVQALLDSLTQASDATDFAASWQRLAEYFHILFTTESSIDALKQTLLQLAVMGKLVPQDSCDEPARELLKRVTEEKAHLVKVGKLKKQKTLAEISQEEKQFDLPPGWEWVRKANIFNFLNGYAFKSEWFRPEGVRLLRNVNVSHGIANWSDSVRISQELASEFDGFQLAENDVVLTLDRPIISTGLKYAVIRQCDLPCLLLQWVAKLAPYSGAVTVGYLVVWLKSRFFVDSIDPGRSNGVPHISTNQVASMPFALPPVAEQHRIVAKVDQLMTFCDQLKTRLTQARLINEQLASTLVEQAVA